MAKKSKLVGKSGRAEVIEVFAAVSNTELNEGRGNDVDRTYHRTRSEAKTAAVGIGVMGSDGKVEPRLAVRFTDGTMLLLAAEEMDVWQTAKGAPVIKFTKPGADQKDIQELDALTKKVNGRRRLRLK